MKPKRYRLYIDESGDPSTSTKSLAQDPYLTLVGVAFETEYYRDEFQPDLEDLKKRHLPYDPDDPPILHRCDIRNGTEAFRVLRDDEKRKTFEEDLVELVGAAKYCLFCVVINKEKNAQRYGPMCPGQYEYAMAGLIPRYAGWLNYSVHGRGDVMAEARYPKGDRDLDRAYEDIYLNGTINYPGPKPVGGKIIQKTITTRSIKFKKKDKNIAGLQLADLLTFCGKVDTLSDYGEPVQYDLFPFTERLLEAIQDKYNRNLFRGGVVKGYGRIYIAPR